ncbi:mitochondrial ribosomal protein L37-domain-containing protein [Scleroderma citrinum]
MSFLVYSRASLRRASSLPFSRRYSAIPSTDAFIKETAKAPLTEEKPPLSSCLPGTVLSGLNYLKGQPPVLAKADEDYPAWLWNLTKPKTFEGEDNLPGGVAEKRRLRKENRRRLQDKNKFGAR